MQMDNNIISLHQPSTSSSSTGAPAALDVLSESLPRVPPSEVARFWRSDDHRDRFTTPQFSAYFGLTVHEARAVLHEYVHEGLLSFSGLDKGVESWLPSRDGQTVFRYGAKKLTKKEVAQIKAVLEGLDLSTELELSIGGRPAFGRPNGRLLVGVQVRGVPYDNANDGLVFSKIYEALDSIGLRSHCTIFIFNESVPYRLRHRLVLRGSLWENAVTKVQALDLDEKEHFERFKKFIKSKGIDYHKPDRDLGFGFSFKFIPGMPPGCAYYVEDLEKSVQFPAVCRQSDVKYLANTAALIRANSDNWEFEYELTRDSRYHGYPVHLLALAELDYAITTGTFQEYVDAIDDISKFGLTFADKTNLPFQLLAALERWRRDVRASRARRDEQKKEKRPPAEFRYEAVFDYLNFKVPLLVGFMRNPRSTDAGWTELCRIWDSLLRRIDGSAGQVISKAGWCAGSFSLYRRAATEEEISAYNALSKKANATLKALFINLDTCIGFPAKQRFTQLELGPVPVVLASSRPPSPVIPKIIFGRSWQSGRDRSTLFEHFEKTGGDYAWVRERLIDAEAVLMRDFAHRSATTQGKDPMVLASGLSDAWQFDATTTGWSATIDAGEWAVRLETEERQLFLEMLVEGASHRVPLTPKIRKRQPDETEYLSALLAFMDKLRSVKEVGYVNWLPEWGARSWGSTPEERLDDLQDLVSDCLTSFPSASKYDSYHGPNWPHFFDQGAYDKRKRARNT
jgi:hypothetical protein